ncbi:MAG: TIGR01548 family HAD-type hydrolase [Myxococcota bacterium]|nr:TIGR01548 family HAD-type hydrolase [Myxococcota bacterium]
MTAAIRPAARVSGVSAYRVPGHPAPVDLDLRGNEGAVPDEGLLRALAGVDILRRYPDVSPFRGRLAARYGVSEDRVLVTAGGDDALDRLCRAVLEPGRSLLLPTPGFEMTCRYARLAGASVVEVPWPGAVFPLEALRNAIDGTIGLIALTSPNNPTGATIPWAAISDVCDAAAAVGAVVLLDLAYVEFADVDPTAAALARDNVVVVRTVSKAWGLAGIRVGFALGPARILSWMAAAGAPYAVSAPSLALAEAALDAGDASMVEFVAGVRTGRSALAEALSAAGCDVVPSEANFVFARSAQAAWLADGLAGLGIGVRTFPSRPGLENALRVAVPPTATARERLLDGLASVARPEALLLDMDGVLVDVSRSYRAAIVAAGAAFGVRITEDDIRRIKASGDANNDWIVTRRLVQAAGVDVALDAVKAAFESAYQGAPGRPGLRHQERLLADRPLLDSLAEHLRLGIVTGRPRADAERLLDQAGWMDRFEVVVCMEDGPAKPDPAPVQLALAKLGVASAWMVGDTPDDIRAARAAGVVPLGLLAPGDRDPAPLASAGAARVVSGLPSLLEMLP